jgi:hypothetical protein
LQVTPPRPRTRCRRQDAREPATRHRRPAGLQHHQRRRALSCGAEQLARSSRRCRNRTKSLDAWDAALRGRPFGINPVIDEFLDERQRATDLLLSNGLLARRIQVRDAVVPWIGDFVGTARATA